MATWVIKTAEDYERAYKVIQDKINKVTEGIPATTLKALIDVAVNWLGRAVDRAPVENGDLRGSAYILVNGVLAAHGNEDGSIKVLSSLAVPAREINRVEIGFAAPYAFVQHEHVEFNHPMGGQAKYLESVIVEGSTQARIYLIESARGGVK